ncbi:hypothetical protein COCMIDRAFT_28239 [Bipolaris oryzae ATCC 44560]|uniref:Uncharacterized protein n=1 Tax=Bipolaris oryzae ATCC 44560 TaxID=930090 RepID=W6Z6W2_COCMI|nr:uncharacterized protein COCMIDRAFT_28239 [Bipolaris oryzae ATCC 44560]EUC43284.1 hypothetical protein COCMIDRAFT_28239 [Bipolaris oryzae ATCC 44560]
MQVVREQRRPQAGDWAHPSVASPGERQLSGRKGERAHGAMGGGWQRGAQEESCVVSSWMRVSMICCGCGMRSNKAATKYSRSLSLFPYSSLLDGGEVGGVERAQVTMASDMAGRGEEKKKTAARRAAAEAQGVRRRARKRPTISTAAMRALDHEEEEGHEEEATLSIEARATKGDQGRPRGHLESNRNLARPRLPNQRRG